MILTTIPTIHFQCSTTAASTTQTNPTYDIMKEPESDGGVQRQLLLCLWQGKQLIGTAVGCSRAGQVVCQTQSPLECLNMCLPTLVDF